MTKCDIIYADLLRQILSSGVIPGRNGCTHRSIELPSVVFDSTPLVTVRKTAWKKALTEMEWILSGEPTCPEELKDWWKDQLNDKGAYYKGYGSQLRYFNGWYDQIKALINGICLHPFGRRHIITTWHPIDQSMITELNNNPKTPTTCHTTVAQFFVSHSGLISMHSYQRSADMLLGVPHNWIQSWALLLWIASQVKTVADKMVWTFGDAHIYNDPSHLKTAYGIIAMEAFETPGPRLLYNGLSGDPFMAKDFEMIGEIPAPCVLERPVLL